MKAEKKFSLGFVRTSWGGATSPRRQRRCARPERPRLLPLPRPSRPRRVLRPCRARMPRTAARRAVPAAFAVGVRHSAPGCGGVGLRTGFGRGSRGDLRNRKTMGQTGGFPSRKLREEIKNARPALAGRAFAIAERRRGLFPGETYSAARFCFRQASSTAQNTRER